jgi:DNA-binding HxlR family transcriptional regulator
MRRTSFSDRPCPVARALDVVGDWWTLLVVRDALAGTTRFEDFRASLGVSRNILAARLDALVEEGVCERRRYEDRPPRDEYLLTKKGRALWRVVHALGWWGMRFSGGHKQPDIRFTHAPCGARVELDQTCGKCGVPVQDDDVRVVRVR